MEADRGHPGLLDQADGQIETGAVTGHQPGADLHSYRQAGAPTGRPGQFQRKLGIGKQFGPGPGLADLRHRATHVDVDQVGPGFGGNPRPGLHRLRRLAE